MGVNPGEEAKQGSELWKVVKFALMGIASTVIELIVFYFLQSVVFSGMRTQPIRFLIFEYEGPGYLWSFLISTTIGYWLLF